MKAQTRFVAILVLMFVISVDFVGAEPPPAPGGDFVAGITTKVSSVVCAFYSAFKSIATGIAALVMVIAGVKWVASENDPGARKAAKDAMIHAVVGLIIITLIGSIIGMFSDLGTPLCGGGA